jgi:hypothetical protein
VIVLLTTAACVEYEQGQEPVGDPTAAVEGYPAMLPSSEQADAPGGEPYPGLLPTEPPPSGAPGTSPDDSYPAPGADAGSDGSRDEDTSAGSAIGDLHIPGYEVVSVLQDWAEFESDDALEEAIDRNLGAGGDNTMGLRLVPDEPQVLAVDYEIDELDPHDFVGFNRDLSAMQAWMGATHVAVLIEPVPGAEEDFVARRAP